MLAAHKSVLSLNEQSYYQALTDNAFNRCEQSDKLITPLLDDHTLPDSLRQRLLVAEADNQLKLFHYRKAAYCYHLLSTQYASLVDSSTVEDYQNSEGLWGAVADVAPQTMTIRHNEVIHFHRDKVGLIRLPVVADADTCNMVFDTGANLSVITESGAKRLHMKTFDVNLDLGNITGGSIKSSMAVADSLYIGGILLQHVIFLLLPDDMLYFEQLDYRQEGIIGEPVIAQLKEVSIGSDSTLRVPLRPSSRNYGNLALYGLTPVAQLTVGADNLVFTFDTGAAGTILYLRYFERYKAQIQQKGTARALRSAGAGGEVVERQSYRLPNWSVGLAGHIVTLPFADVNTEPVGDDKDSFYGNLGQDLFRLYNTLTINFENMYLEAK